MKVVVSSTFVSAFSMRDLDCEEGQCVLKSDGKTVVDTPHSVARMFSENNLIPISKPKARRKQKTPVKRKTVKKTVRRKPAKSVKKKSTKRLQVGGRRKATKTNKKKKCVKRKK